MAPASQNKKGEIMHKVHYIDPCHFLCNVICISYEKNMKPCVEHVSVIFN